MGQHSSHFSMLNTYTL